MKSKISSFRIIKPHKPHQGKGICIEWHEKKPLRMVGRDNTIPIYIHHYIRIEWQ